MYSWGNRVTDTEDKDREKYLLGKPIDEKNEKLPVVIKENVGNKLNEDFIKIHEDPLFMIKQ